MSKNEYEEMIQWRLKAMKSFNYQYVYMILKTLFFTHTLFEMCTNTEVTTKVLGICAQMTSKEMKIELDERYLNLKHHFATGDDGSRSIIIEFEGPFLLETECNFVALVKYKDGTKIMYTSEYYEDSNRFKLCKTDQGGSRFSFSNVTNNLKEFLQAINHVIE